MFGVGTQELIIILAILLLLFGGKKLPEFSKSLGESIKEIRNGFADEKLPKTESEKKKGD